MEPSPTPYGLLFPKIWDLQPPPKTPIAIVSGTDKATDFKFGQINPSEVPNKSPLKLLEKRECGRIQGLPKFFWVPPIISLSGTGKTTDFKFGQYTFTGSFRIKAH